jgi:lysylphosphatidylglycerol synthetase-like protein (DUF2156 family)
MNALRRFVAKQPFSVAVAAVMIAFAVVTQPFGRTSLFLRQLLGTGYESMVDNGHWWSPVTSLFVVEDGVGLVFALAGALIVLAFAERLMGTVRTVIAFFVTAIIGIGVGVGGQAIGVANGEMWSRGVRELWSNDPYTAMFGAIMAASCFTGPLWRRRIRVLTLSAALVLLLYSGQPSDLYRLIAALVGLGLGAAFRPRRINLTWLTWRRSSDHETRTLLGAVVAMLAIGPVITVYSRGRYGILAPLGLLFTQDPPSTSGGVEDRCLLGNITNSCVHELTLARVDGVGPVLVSLLPLLTLLVAAYGLTHGRRFAALLAIAINTGMAVIGAWYYGLLPISGQPYVWRWHSTHYWEVAVELIVSGLVPVTIAIVLATNLRHFPVATRPGRRRRFIVTTLSSFIALSALYVGVGWLLRDHFRPTVTLSGLLADLPERFIPVGFLQTERLTFVPTDWLSATLYQWIGPVFWAIVVVGAILCMRTAPLGSLDDDEARVRALLTTGGGGSLSFMATWVGNTIWFNATGTTAIAYRVVNGVAITTTEPIGPPSDVAAAIADFAVLCDDHGWVPVFYSLHEEFRPIFTRMGWQMMGIAEETVLRPSSWTTTGKKWQDIRSSINRAQRAGVRSEWTTYRALPLQLSQQIAEISEQWVQDKGLPELGFTLGGLEELRDQSVRLMLAIDTEDQVLAVTSWLPTYRDGTIVGWTLDFMRRRPESMNGVMEFLIAETAALMKTQPEIEFLSLSAAPLARADADKDREGSLAARMLDFIGRTLEPVYGFRSLLAFKRKFQPEFHSLFMAFPDPVSLPNIGVALARAYLPSLSVREAMSFVRGLN